MTDVLCHGCGAQLAADQRWCVLCGARRAGADARTLLFGLPQPPAAGTEESRPAGAAATSADGSTTARGLDPSVLAARRRRAALPVALVSLAGLVAMSATSVPASLAGSSAPQPYTVVLPAQVAGEVEEAPPAAEPAAPPVDETVAPAVVAETPAPVVATPSAADDSAPEDRAHDRTPAKDQDDAAPIRHVFLIALGGADVNALARDEAAAPYLAGTLADRGTLLSGYRTVGLGGLANRIALVSGQGPTAQTLDDCATYGDLTPADPRADGQTGGDGCIYDAKTKHIGDQLRAQKRTWKAYVEPAAEVALAPCEANAETTRRNPFLWFRGTVEADDCDERNVPLAQLRKDLRAAKTTPAFAWIASDAQQGSADADAFLERVVPLIQDSPAYADGGLIVIVGDQPPPETPAPPADPAEQPADPAAPPTDPSGAPASPAPTTPTDPAPTATTGAGVTVGALLISPHTPAGKVSAAPADAFTLLRTLQRFYDVDPLGHAGADSVKPLPAKLFSTTP